MDIVLLIFSMFVFLLAFHKSTPLAFVAFVRFVHAWDWIYVCWKYWFKGYRPKSKEGTNFSRGTNNVLQIKLFLELESYLLPLGVHKFGNRDIVNACLLAYLLTYLLTHSLTYLLTYLLSRRGCAFLLMETIPSGGSHSFFLISWYSKIN